MAVVAPSMLGADFGRLRELAELVAPHSGYLHMDVMDGHFVPNLTIGPPVVASLRKATTVPLDVHLMIEAPGNWAADYLDAGADMISVHYEADTHLHRTVQAIRARAAADWHDATSDEMTIPSTIGEEKATNPFMRAADATELGRLRALKDNF